MNMNEKVEYMKTQRGDAADAALRTVKKLRDELEWMETAITCGQAGTGVYAGDLVPYHQTLTEVVAYGTEYRTLWNAVGPLERS